MHFLGFWALGIGLGVLSATLLLHATHLHGARHPRPHFQIIRWLHAHLLVAAVCAVLAGFLAGIFAVTGYALIKGDHGFVQPPWVAQQPHGVRTPHPKHTMGFVPQSGRHGRPSTFSAYTVPAAVDLSQNDVPVGYQGAVNACASWAVAYGLRGWYANRDHNYPVSGFAPMYVYSQITGGVNIGTSFPSVFNVVTQQGVDTATHYYQGPFNYWQQPTYDERANAQRYHSAGMQTLFVGQNQGIYAQQAIEQAMAAGDPVVLGIPVYENFMNASASAYYIAGAGSTYYGNHAILAVKYDANGIFVENSWSTVWGLNGYVELSWAFVDAFALEADSMVMPHAVIPAASTPAPLPRSRVTPRPTRRLTPQPAPHPRPTATPHHKAPQRHAGYWLLIRAQQVRLRPALWPSTHRPLKPGIRLHATGRVRGKWRQFYVPGGVGWVLAANVRRIP